jgi:L-histidine N-alpha-methyltransferase
MNHTAVKPGEMEVGAAGLSLVYTQVKYLEVNLQGKDLEVMNYLNGNHREQMINDIRRGMMGTQKSIPSKYFYDARGSQLFDQICMTPEYYPTKTELSILEQSAGEIMQFFSQEGGDLIELGSGSNRKIRKLLDAVHPFEHGRIRYIPIDISKNCLLESVQELLGDYKNLAILGVLADFTRHMGGLPRSRKLIVFLGSTIGNFQEEEAITLLRRVRANMNRDDRFLLGMDMIKSGEVLEAAYNDRQGVTCDFNRNILVHINRELNSDFDPEDFDHLAYFNVRRERVEMHLRARRTMTAYIADLGLSVDIKKGDTLRTEICKKFSLKSARRLFRKAGMSIARWFTDSKGWFSLVELQVSSRQGRKF